MQYCEGVGCVPVLSNDHCGSCNNQVRHDYPNSVEATLIFVNSALDQATVPNRDLDMNASAISLPVLIAKASPIIWKVYFVVWRAHIVIFSAKEVFDLYSLIKRELRY